MPLTLCSHILCVHVLVRIIFLPSLSEASYYISLMPDNVGDIELFTPVDETCLVDSTSQREKADVFLWDKNSTSAERYQISYCSVWCNGDTHESLYRFRSCWNVTCFPCDCHKPRCQFYGTCCPDMEPSENYDFSSLINHSLTVPNQKSVTSVANETATFSTRDYPLVLVCDGEGDSAFLQIKSCPTNYPDGDTKSKCQDAKTIITYGDLDTLLHVTDNVTGHSYFNKYCATCHGVTQITAWAMSVACASNMLMYKAKSPEDLFSLIADSLCQLQQMPPIHSELTNCNKTWFEKSIINTCNVTGDWQVYDADVMRACEDISGKVNQVKIVTYSDDVIFKNIFCVVCNMNEYPETPNKCDGSHHVLLDDVQDSVQRLPFSVLLNFDPGERLTHHQQATTFMCSPDSGWLSPENKCYSLQCTPGKVLINGSCSTAITQICGLVYKIHVDYIPITFVNVPSSDHNITTATYNRSNLSQKYLNMFKHKFHQIISLGGQEFQIMITMVFSDNVFTVLENQSDQLVNSSHTFQTFWFTVEGFIQGHEAVNRDIVEQVLVTELILNNITVDIDTNTSLTLSPVLDPARKGRQVKCDVDHEKKVSSISSLLVSPVALDNNKQAILIEPHLINAYLEFNRDEYLFNINNTEPQRISNITLYFQEAWIRLSEVDELNMVAIDGDGILRVCYEMLHTKTKTLMRLVFAKTNHMKMAQYMLTIIFLTFSMLCLTFTIMTYFLFPVLYSSAGKNNIFLSGSLLMAQLLLLATSHIPETGHICTVLAVCTHYSWLSMFCWCFTCCFHMFCIFSAKTRNLQTTASSEKIYMIKRVVLCSILPGLIVTGVITTNYSMSRGKLIGYGSVTCFIDSQLIMIITLVIPLCLIIVLNFIFFSITVIKIYNVFKLHSRGFRKDDHNNLYIYMKLSSMTGIFWILSVISEATNNDPLRFIAIGLNGLQGVFIFLSYICNRRVLRLYMKLLGLANMLAAKSVSDRNTVEIFVAGMEKHGDRSELSEAERSCDVSNTL